MTWTCLMFEGYDLRLTCDLHICDLLPPLAIINVNCVYYVPKSKVLLPILRGYPLFVSLSLEDITYGMKQNEC